MKELTDADGKKHDWRRDLVAELVKRQRPDGSWVNSDSRWMEGEPSLVTGYALLALSYCKPAERQVDMDLFDAIANRYSYRGEFTDAPVPRADLEKIVQAGIQAPSACNEQVASFVIVDDPPLLRQIAEILGKAGLPVGQGDDRVRGRSAAGVRAGCRLRPKTARRRSRTCCWRSPPWAMPACGSTASLRTEDRAARIGRLLGVPAGRHGPHPPADRRARRAGRRSERSSRSPTAPGSIATAASTSIARSQTVCIAVTGTRVRSRSADLLLRNGMNSASPASHPFSRVVFPKNRSVADFSA